MWRARKNCSLKGLVGNPVSTAGPGVVVKLGFDGGAATEWSFLCFFASGSSPRCSSMFSFASIEWGMSY
jgi:hypothetical protein